MQRATLKVLVLVVHTRLMHDQYVAYLPGGSIPREQMQKDSVNAAASVSAKMNVMLGQERSIKFILRHQSNNSAPLSRQVLSYRLAGLSVS